MAVQLVFEILGRKHPFMVNTFLESLKVFLDNLLQILSTIWTGESARIKIIATAITICNPVEDKTAGFKASIDCGLYIYIVNSKSD